MRSILDSVSFSFCMSRCREIWDCHCENEEAFSGPVRMILMELPYSAAVVS